MLVTKRLDLSLLLAELAAASVVVNGLGAFPDEQGRTNLHTYDQEGAVAEMPPEAVPVVDAHDASKPERTAAFEQAEDAERLRIVAERARTDPAFAALAELALKGADR